MECVEDSLYKKALRGFHPAVRAWFEATFKAPTQAQLEAWPAIKSGSHTLISAPTGSGKTLAAFLGAIDDLVWQAIGNDSGDTRLDDHTRIVYVSPLKALSNDIHKNLALPLQGVSEQLSKQGLGDLNIRAMVRSGDTPQSERQRMRRKPPHILVTTPESLYLLLSSDSGRRGLSTAHTLIVDEIHAMAGNKRGAHLALSMERLQDLCARPLTRIGLSATQKPLAEVARFLTGTSSDKRTIIDSGHLRDRDLAIEVTGSPLEAVMSSEVWEALYQRLIALVEAHDTTLIFVNTRRLAERIAKALSEPLGEQAVTSHHGSLAREHRLEAERLLKAGQLRALVATASLELGIDIGDVDLVCQIGSPRAINTLLQRVGRSGHAVDAVPKGRLFPTSRDELVECVALLDAVMRGELDRLTIPQGPLDVLAQQLVAEVSCGECLEDDLFAQVRRAWPYRSLAREVFDTVLNMLAEGFATRRGRRAALLHHDRVNRRLRPRRGARLTALLNGGAIPDLFDYDVILQPEGAFIGTLNEDFAFESLPGDIFQLGNTSYRLLKTEKGKVHVEDAHGLPPNIPFWFGEAPGRSDELSRAVSDLRTRIQNSLQTSQTKESVDWARSELSMSTAAAVQLVEYLGTAHAALGSLPTQDSIVFERFFDEAGDQHLVIHAPFGSRLNRAWGLALRKRFCRKFNFELQAAALEDCIVLSLGSTHSFPLEEVARYLKADTVREILIQALLDVPMFATHWRWNATIALAVRRNRNGQRVPAQLQRMDAEDLIAVVFPDQLACLENIAGNREIPDHPLVDQTLHDCLHEVMDIEGLETLLRRIEVGEVRIHTRDLAGPSPLAQEILAARPYAFLDDAPAEERRTQMVQARRFMTPQQATELAVLSPEAIARVCAQAWPEATDADELHDAMMLMAVLTEQEGKAMGSGKGWDLMQELIRDDRAGVLTAQATKHRLWVCAERLSLVQALFPDAVLQPKIRPVGKPREWVREAAMVELVRARLEGLGPVTAETMAQSLNLPGSEIDIALIALESEGFAMRGRFTAGVDRDEWCERGLLARIHRYTLKRLREQVKPVSRTDLMAFLIHWHGLDESGEELGEGERSLFRIIEQLEGFPMPAAAWESEILPTRLSDYRPSWLDRLGSTGRVMWLRLISAGAREGVTKGVSRGRGANGSDRSMRTGVSRGITPIRTTPIVLIGRRHFPHWNISVTGPERGLSSTSRRVLDRLDEQGASFVDDILADTGLLHTQLEASLAELAALGWVSSDTFVGLRALMVPSNRRKPLPGHRRRGGVAQGVEDAGRWFSLRNRQGASPEADDERGAAHIEHIAKLLLRRYGVVFRALLTRESGLIPSWRELLYAYRRMEARGELRGGRFVQGFSGEQFALPEAVGLLRKLRRREKTGTLLAISAADPLNLVGIVLPGQRVPALTGNRVLYRDGKVLAVSVAGKIQILGEMDDATAWEVSNALLPDFGRVKRMNVRV